MTRYWATLGYQPGVNNYTVCVRNYLHDNLAVGRWRYKLFTFGLELTLRLKIVYFCILIVIVRLLMAMGNLRNAKCESAKGNLRNHVRKMRAKNG